MSYSCSSLSVDALLDSMSDHTEMLNQVVYVLDNGHLSNAKEELNAFVYASEILSESYDTKSDLHLLGRLFYKNFRKVDSLMSDLLLEAERRIYSIGANSDAKDFSADVTSIDIEDVKALFLCVCQAYKGWSFDMFEKQCKEDYLSFENPKELTYSDWVNGQTRALSTI